MKNRDGPPEIVSFGGGVMLGVICGMAISSIILMCVTLDVNIDTLFALYCSLIGFVAVVLALLRCRIMLCFGCACSTAAVSMLMTTVTAGLFAFIAMSVIWFITAGIRAVVSLAIVRLARAIKAPPRK